MFCDCAIPRTAGSAPIWETPRLAGEAERFARRGAEVFAHNCTGCHGPAGHGDGPAAAALLPAPRNLTTAQISSRRLSESLWNGLPGSSMPPWNDLATADLRGLVAYLTTLAPAEPAPALTDAERSQGRAIYTRECVVCHGPDGRGDGPAAAILAPTPTNFHEVRPTLAHAEVALADGVRGSAMPRWRGKLTPDEQKMMARFVRTFFGKE